MSKIRSLEETVRSLLTEQKAVPEKLSINIGSTKHDPTSPNAKHIEEDEQIDEIIGTATSLGPKHNPKSDFTKKSLGGRRLRTRALLQGRGNQKRSPTIYEATQKALAKVKLKKEEKKEDQMTRGKTATGQPSEPVDTKPVKPEIAGSY